jgi:hypothetical protein
VHCAKDSCWFVLNRTGDPVQQPIDEQAGFVEAKQHKELIKYCRSSLKSINSDLEKVNQQMAKLIENDQHLKELFTLMTSIPGVGSATATEVILATDEFKAITDPKKLAASAVRLPCRGSSFRASFRDQCPRENSSKSTCSKKVEITFSFGGYVSNSLKSGAARAVK